MSIRVKEYSVCADCYVFAAYGMVGEDLDDYETRQGEVERAFNALLHGAGPDAQLTTGDGETEFSWEPCECCGSHLGGSRHTALILIPQENAAAV